MDQLSPEKYKKGKVPDSVFQTIEKKVKRFENHINVINLYEDGQQD